MNALLRFDGGAKPGNATAGAIVSDANGVTIAHVGRALGTATNNDAEHTALLIGLELALELGVTQLRVYGDSDLVLGQAFGGWRIATERLRVLAEQSRSLAQRFETLDYQHVRRELNAAPDALCHAVEDGWWMPPGASYSDGTASLAFVLSLELPLAILDRQQGQRDLKATLHAAIDATFPLAISRSVGRTTAAPYRQPSKSLGIITYVARLHVSAHVAGNADRRTAVETKLRDALATRFAGARLRVARISG